MDVLTLDQHRPKELHVETYSYWRSLRHLGSFILRFAFNVAELFNGTLNLLLHPCLTSAHADLSHYRYTPLALPSSGIAEHRTTHSFTRCFVF